MNAAKFRGTFTTPHEQYADREGQMFVVLGEITEPDDTHDAEVLPMYRIRFLSDGFEVEAWPEEVLRPGSDTTAQAFWRAPSGRVHSLRSCSGGAPVKRMRQAWLTREEFDQAGVDRLSGRPDMSVRCRCAKWREDQR